MGLFDGLFSPKTSTKTASPFDPYFRKNVEDITATIQNRPPVSFERPAPTFVGMTPEQQAGMEAYQGFLSESRPAFGRGVEAMNRTVAGDYLDPTKTPAFANLSNVLRASGAQTY